MIITPPAPTVPGDPSQAHTGAHQQAVGNVAGISQEEWADLASAALGPTSITGPFEKVHVFWLAGMS